MQMKSTYLCLQILTCMLFASTTWGQRAADSPWAGREKLLGKVEKMFGDPPGMTRIDKVSRVWVDRKAKRVVVDGYIALRAGQLEMLACPVGTKEHESVVAVFSKAQVVHAGLLAIGAQTGTPVSWEPVYKAPTGSEIQVLALWVDADGKKHNIDTRKWVHQLGTEKDTLDTNYVFAGSKMWKDPDTGEELYQAESGDLICVSNFATATLDVPLNSSQANSGLMFAAMTDAIPPEGTPIRLVLQLVDPDKSKAADSKGNTENSLTDITGKTSSSATSPPPTTPQSPANGSLPSPATPALPQ
jgi:hypothetical protein